MLCQNAHQQLFQILQMLQNYLVLPSQRRRSLEGKGGQIFEEGTRFQVLRRRSIDVFQHIPVIIGGMVSAVIGIAATRVSLSSNSNQNVIYL